MEQISNQHKVPLECLLGVINALVGATRTEKEQRDEAVASFPSGAKGINFKEKTQQRPSLKYSELVRPSYYKESFACPPFVGMSWTRETHTNQAPSKNSNAIQKKEETNALCVLTKTYITQSRIYFNAH
jgi:hypothetical protein